MRISTTLEMSCVLSRNTSQLLNLIPRKENSDLHRAKEALQRWKKAKRTIRLRQEKVRLRKLHEAMEAGRQLMPPGTSLHSSPLAAPLMIPPATFHTLSNTATSRDDVMTSADPAPEPETPPASPSLLQQILAAPLLSALPEPSPEPSPPSAPRVNFHSVESFI